MLAGLQHDSGTEGVASFTYPPIHLTIHQTMPPSVLPPIQPVAAGASVCLSAGSQEPLRPQA